VSVERSFRGDGQGRGKGQSDQGKDRRRGVVLAGGDSDLGVDRRASGPGVTAAIDGDELGAPRADAERREFARAQAGIRREPDDEARRVPACRVVRLGIRPPVR